MLYGALNPGGGRPGAPAANEQSNETDEHRSYPHRLNARFQRGLISAASSQRVSPQALVAPTAAHRRNQNVYGELTRYCNELCRLRDGQFQAAAPRLLRYCELKALTS
jgi:hypothetical protein